MSVGQTLHDIEAPLSGYSRKMLRRDFLAAMTAFLKSDKVEEAARLIERATESGEVSAAVLRVQHGGDVFSRAFGKAKTPETVFLIASITKPMTATGVMVLADRGMLSLSDPVRKFIPEFQGGDRDSMTIRHLLTHTSGLPDMLPENIELRKRFSPLSEFVSGVVRTPLLFKPGARVQYQSMGILLASEIARRVTDTVFPEFLRKEVFVPLGMNRTSLGLGSRKIPDTAICQVAEEKWGWNSTYWRNLGAPWGGAHSTAVDINRFLRSFAKPDGKVLKPETARSMVTPQTKFPGESYGFGWRTTRGGFGRACSERTYGHAGATGTLCWLDPDADLSFVVLTTKPLDASEKTLLHPVSDLVSEAR